MIAAEPVALVIDDCAQIDVLFRQTQVRLLKAQAMLLESSRLLSGSNSLSLESVS